MTVNEARVSLNKFIDLLPKLTEAGGRLQSVLASSMQFEDALRDLDAKQAALNAVLVKAQADHQEHLTVINRERVMAEQALQAQQTAVASTLATLDAELAAKREAVSTELTTLRQSLASAKAAVLSEGHLTSSQIGEMRAEARVVKQALVDERDALAQEIGELKAERSRILSHFAAAV